MPRSGKTTQISTLEGLIPSKQILNSYELRMVCLAAFFLACVIGFDRYFQDVVVPAKVQQLAQRLAQKPVNVQDWSKFETIEEARKADSTWLCLIKSNGKVSPESPMLPPSSIKKGLGSSKKIVSNGKTYFDAAVPVSGGVVHVGARNDYLLKRLFSSDRTFNAVVVAIFAFMTAILGTYIWLLRPLHKLSKNLRAVLQTNKTGDYSTSVEGFDYEINDVKTFAGSLKEILSENQRMLRLTTIEQSITDVGGARDKIPVVYAGKQQGKGTKPSATNENVSAIEIAENTDSPLLDPLTGFPSVAIFSESLQEIFDRKTNGVPNQAPYSILLVSIQIDESEDHAKRDRAIKTLANAISASVRTEDMLAGKLSRYTDYIVRYTSNCFAVVLGWADEGNAREVSRRIIDAFVQSVKQKNLDAKLKPSIGVASYSGDGESMQSLLASAFSALRFTEKEYGAGAVRSSKDIPIGYKQTDSAAVIAGELGVLGGYGLLQSLASSHKTGELKVTHQGSNSLRVLFQDGKPLEVNFGELNGKEALVEFLISYKNGKFQFKERGFTRGTQVIVKEKIPLSLERCLMDAAVAEDHMVVAKRSLELDSCIMSVNPDEQMQKLFSQRKDFSDEEKTAMTALVSSLDKCATLKQLFLAVKMPDYLKWRAAHLLSDSGVIQLMADE